MKRRIRFIALKTLQDIDDGVKHVITNVPRNPSIQIIVTRTDIFDLKVTLVVSFSPKLITLFMKKNND